MILSRINKKMWVFWASNQGLKVLTFPGQAATGGGHWGRFLGLVAFLTSLLKIL